MCVMTDGVCEGESTEKYLFLKHLCTDPLHQIKLKFGLLMSHSLSEEVRFFL